LGVPLFHVDRPTDEHDEANIRFSQLLCERAFLFENYSQFCSPVVVSRKFVVVVVVVVVVVAVVVVIIIIIIIIMYLFLCVVW